VGSFSFLLCTVLDRCKNAPRQLKTSFTSDQTIQSTAPLPKSLTSCSVQSSSAAHRLHHILASPAHKRSPAYTHHCTANVHSVHSLCRSIHHATHNHHATHETTYYTLQPSKCFFSMRPSLPNQACPADSSSAQAPHRRCMSWVKQGHHFLQSGQGATQDNHVLCAGM